jgi:hypothetical protein
MLSSAFKGGAMMPATSPASNTIFTLDCAPIALSEALRGWLGRLK